jgi:hypothetical protein
MKVMFTGVSENVGYWAGIRGLGERPIEKFSNPPIPAKNASI